MKLSKRVVLSLITILMSIGIFAISVDPSRADSRFSTSCQLDKFLHGNENQTYATLGLSCKNLGRQLMNLGNYIANNDGTLAWRLNGNFQETCADSFIEQNHILKSTCKKIDGSRIDSQLDLDEILLVEGYGDIVYTGPSDSKRFRIVLIPCLPGNPQCTPAKDPPPPVGGGGRPLVPE